MLLEGSEPVVDEDPSQQLNVAARRDYSPLPSSIDWAERGIINGP